MDNRRNRYSNQPEQKEFDEKIIQINRISKKTKGGNKISFSALVVVGDRKSKAGVGFEKAPDVLSAIKKSIRRAKDSMVEINLVDGTIPHEIFYKKGAAKILLKPAPVGTGVIAGGTVRSVVEAFGVKNIVSKRLGTTNKVSNTYATFEALQNLRAVKRLQKQEIKPMVKKDKTQIATKKVTKGAK